MRSFYVYTNDSENMLAISIDVLNKHKVKPGEAYSIEFYNEAGTLLKILTGANHGQQH